MPVVIHKQELSAVAPEGVPSANPTDNTTLIPPGPPVNPLGTRLYANPFFDPAFWRAVTVSGARMLRDLGQFTTTRAQWGAAMVKRFGTRIIQALNATWTRLMRLQNQEANGVSAVGQGHLNQIEVASVNANIAEEQKPFAAAPSVLMALSPKSSQIAYFGSGALMGEKRQIDVTGGLFPSRFKRSFRWGDN